MEVDSFIKWRISDIGQFYTVASGGDPERAIAQRVNEGLRNAFGRRTLHITDSVTRKTFDMTVSVVRLRERLGDPRPRLFEAVDATPGAHQLALRRFQDEMRAHYVAEINHAKQGTNSLRDGSNAPT